MTLRRHGSALLVATFLVGQLTALVHQSTTQHSRCPEHGELIHGGSADGPAAGDGVAVRGFPTAPRHEHDPCELSVASRERVTPPAEQQATAATPQHERAEVTPPAREPGASLALFRTAPKTSPPA